MDGRAKRQIVAAFAIWAAVTAILFWTGLVKRQKVWANPQLSWEAGETYRSDTAEYGVKSSGPYLDLAAGEYRLQWQIEGDGANEIRLSCSNGARIEPSVLPVEPGLLQGEAAFRLLDPAHSFSVGVTFAAGTEMTFYSLRLYSPEYTDTAFLLSGALLLAAVFFALRRSGKLTREGAALLAVLAAAALLAGAPSLQDDTTGSWDVQFHAARLCNLADALRSGQFPARVGGFSYNGYGAATSVFYPDLFLYPWALMLLGGCSLSFVLNAILLYCNIATVALGYYAARRLGLLREGSAASAILYTLCAYRLTDAYVGYMQGELIAMAFVPPFIAALWETLFEDGRRWKELALWACAVFYAHVLTTLLCMVLAMAFFTVSLPSHLRKKQGYREIAYALSIAIALCGRRIIPLLQLYAAGVNSANAQFGFIGNTLSGRQLLDPAGRMGTASVVFAVIGMASLAKERNEATCRQHASFLLIGFLFVFAASDLFPWSYVLKLVGEQITILQFPWRFLLIAVALWAIAGGYGAQNTFSGRAAAVTLVVCVMASVPVPQEASEAARGVHFGEGANPYMVYPEYQIEGTDVNDTRNREPMTDGDLTLSDYRKDGTTVSAKLSSAEGGALTLPLFAFPGYEARLNGQKAAWARGANNRLKVTVPPGFEGELDVRYAGFALWKALDVQAAVTAACLLVQDVRRRRKEVRHAGEKG